MTMIHIPCFDHDTYLRGVSKIGHVFVVLFYKQISPNGPTRQESEFLCFTQINDDQCISSDI